jgi:hypothetical protein
MIDEMNLNGASQGCLMRAGMVTTENLAICRLLRKLYVFCGQCCGELKTTAFTNGWLNVFTNNVSSTDRRGVG